MAANDMHSFFPLGTAEVGMDSTNNDRVLHENKIGLTFHETVDARVANTLGFCRRITGRRVCVRIMRNNTGVELKAGEVVSIDPDAGIEGLGVAVSLSANLNQRHSYIVDPFLGTSTVPVGGVFYCVISGPAYVRMPAGGADITAGDVLVADAAGVPAVGALPADSAFIMGTFLETSLAADNDPATGHLVPVDVCSLWG